MAKKKLKDSKKLGFRYFLVIAALIYFAIKMVDLFVSTSGDVSHILKILIVVYAIPLATFFSGLFNYALFSNQGCSKAAKVNILSALVTFLIIGGCLIFGR